MQLPTAAFFPKLKNPKTPPRETLTILELLRVQLSPPRYREKNEELLASELETGHRNDQIRRLARSYITELLAQGFSHRYISETTQNFFFYGKDRIGQNSAIRDFFLLFPEKQRSFKVICKLDELFRPAATAFLTFKVQIGNNIPDEIDRAKFSSFAPGVSNLFGVVLEVKARDCYAARYAAEQRIKLCSTLLSLFHHRKTASWSDEALVFDEERTHTSLVRNSTNPMTRCSDLIEEVATQRLQRFLSEFTLEDVSFSKFIRSAQLHAMALKSDSSENQILNLWIALESLIPSEAKGEDVSNIEHIVNSLMPFLCQGYLERLLNSYVKDLGNWNKTASKRLFAGVTGFKLVDKLAKILALPEHEARRDNFKSQFRDFHLMKDRFEYFQSLLSSPSSLLTALDTHRIRLEWQIRRIYRTRNIIVHSGQTPSYTRVLIEHAHDYLDLVLTGLIKLASSPRKIVSVSQGFKYVEMKYATYYSNLKASKSFETENIDHLLFDR